MSEDSQAADKQQKSENISEKTEGNSDYIGVDKTKLKAFAILGSIAAGFVLCLWFYSQGQPLAGLIVLFTGIGGPMILTESGRYEIKKAMEDSNQSQTTHRKQNRKQICSECGWQNPHSNNFCIDCGRELGTEAE